MVDLLSTSLPSLAAEPCESASLPSLPSFLLSPKFIPRLTLGFVGYSELKGAGPIIGRHDTCLLSTKFSPTRVHVYRSTKFLAGSVREASRGLVDTGAYVYQVSVYG